MSRIVAKKIVSWLKSSLSSLPFFARDLEQDFCPHSSVRQWDVGLPSFALSMANAVHGHTV